MSVWKGVECATSAQCVGEHALCTNEQIAYGPESRNIGDSCCIDSQCKCYGLSGMGVIDANDTQATCDGDQDHYSIGCVNKICQMKDNLYDDGSWSTDYGPLKCCNGGEKIKN